MYLDTDDEGIYDEVAGLGRHNHENQVIVPGGWDGVASLSGDDTFDAPGVAALPVICPTASRR